MKSYYAYIRVSTVKQERGTSLDEQRSAIDAYARRNDLNVVAWFEEMETAAKQGRRQFTRMLAELQKGNAAGVVIHKIDRSARNLKDWARLGDLIDAGVDVRFAHESIDLTSRGGRLSADIQAVVAADFIRNHRQVVKMGFRGRLKQGLYPLPAPRGYLDQGKGKPKLVDPVVGPLVRQAFELYASGNYSIPLLRLEMERRGLRSAKGKALSLDALSQLLHNPFYTGLIHIRSTNETFQGVHEPLVKQAVFERVQAHMASRTFGRPHKHEPLFRRTIRCAVCEYSLIGEVQKGHTYYRCHSIGCRGTSLREVDIADDLRAFLRLVSVDEVDLGEFRDFLETNRADDAAHARRRRAENARLLAQCEGRLTRLTDALLDGDLDKDMYEARKAGLLKERRKLQDLLEAPEEETAGERLLKKLELGKTALVSLDTKFAPQLRDTLRKMTSNLSVREKNLDITACFPFDEIAKERLIRLGAPYSQIHRNGSTFCFTGKHDLFDVALTKKAPLGPAFYEALAKRLPPDPPNIDT